MNSKINLNIRILFYSVWFVGLLLQAYFTELTSDEAYYWMYSNNLAWGYFDHPPVIAFIIKLGYSIFPNELGVRLLPVIFSTLTLFVLEKIVKPKEIKPFIMLVSSVGILHIIGFFAIPDAPFIFLSTVYLYLYQKFTINKNIKNAIFLGISIALMCLSKYHGLIIIGLSVLSNLKLLSNRYFWLVTIISILLLVPHFLWQLNANFPSINYHLFERSTEAYKFTYSLEYLISQLVVLGPITGIIFFIAAIKEKTNNQFEKTLKFLFWGGYIFFFIMSFKGRVEAHWTLYIVLPALYFGYNYLIKLKNTMRVLNITFLISITLIILFRLLIIPNLMLDNIPMIARLTKDFRNKNTMLAIKNIAKDYPVAFMNSYQNASLYSFYSKSDGFSLNNIMGRKNQFDLWNVEDKYRGQSIILIPNYYVEEFAKVPGISEDIRFTRIDNFQSFSKIRISAVKIEKEADVSTDMNVKVILTSTDNNINLDANSDYPSYIYYQFFDGKDLVKEDSAIRINNDMLNKEILLNIKMPDTRGVYGLFFSIKTGWLPPSINSKRYKMSVVDN